MNLNYYREFHAYFFLFLFFPLLPLLPLLMVAEVVVKNVCFKPKVVV